MLCNKDGVTGTPSLVFIDITALMVIAKLICLQNKDITDVLWLFSEGNSGCLGYTPGVSCNFHLLHSIYLCYVKLRKVSNKGGKYQKSTRWIVLYTHLKI